MKKKYETPNFYMSTRWQDDIILESAPFQDEEVGDNGIFFPTEI